MYAAARARQQASLGASRPYLVLAEQKLVLRYQGKVEERSVASARFDAIKHASHVPIAAMSAILAGLDAQALRALADRLKEALSVVAAAQLGNVEDAARSVMRASVDLLEAALVKTPMEVDLHAFGLETRADTTRLLQAGCDESLARIDAATRQLRPLVGDAWPTAVVAIATDHQSRAEEVGVQYFERLFDERAKEGALGESRIVVIESIGPNDGTLQAVASHLYDQRLSLLLFDDPTFLQGDVLGKHAEPTIARLLATPF
jgi:plasmid stability protein